MGRFRAGGRIDTEYLAVYVDFHGADKQRAVSVGGGEQGGAIGQGDCGGEGDGGEVELVAFYQVVVAFGRGGHRGDRDI